MSPRRKSVLPGNVGTTRERMEWFNATPNFYRDAAVLREARNKLGVSQAELAKKTGLKKSLIADVETKRRKFSEEIREAIWQGLFDLGPSGNLSAEDPRSAVRHTVMEALRLSMNATAERPSTMSSIVIKKQEEELGGLRAENTALHDLVEALKKQKAAKQPDSNEALANLIEGTSAGPLGQFLGDMLAPDRPGAFERYKANCKPVVQERERLVSRLENATSIDDPIVQEVIESLRREIAELKGEQPGLASCLLLFQSAASGRQLTDSEFADAIAASDRVKKLKAAKAEDSDE